MPGDLEDLRHKLLEASPQFCGAVFSDLAPRLLSPNPSHVGGSRRAKDLNDPIWKTITLEGVELDLLDLPLMQRLRHVRQLGMAYLVFPTAMHSRLEHSIGALHAAKLLFDRLVATSCIALEAKDKLRRVVLMAALLHDCGHTAFSHVGEPVLNEIYRDELNKVRDVLDDYFVDAIKHASDKVISRKKPPPAAELLSVLIVLSPQMEKLLTEWGIAAPQETTLMVSGLIVGRPTKFLRIEGNNGTLCSHDFVKAIVSGDLDADKLDYVARDAYFAGMPISADMTRLLSQVSAAELNKTTEFERELDFEPPNPLKYELLGVKPAGCSALEMFVLTRSYLFERIYCHHKIRAAERTVERLLRQRLVHGIRNQAWEAKDVLNFMFLQAGDDALLWALSTQSVPGDDEERFKQFANRILYRQLPQRALALSPRFLVDYKKGRVKLPGGAAAPWDQSDAALRGSGKTEMEKWICNVTGIPRADSVFIDPPVINPIKENPDIWVLDKIDRTRLQRVNRYFDAEQLANAYQDVKQVAWIFSAAADRPRVAAAAAVYLASRFDLFVGEEAIRQAKLTRSEFSAEVEKLKPSLTDVEKAAAVDLLSFSPASQRIRSSKEQWETAFRLLPESERRQLAERLMAQFAAVGVPRNFYDDFLAILLVISALVKHAVSPSVSEEIDKTPGARQEDRFQAHLVAYLNRCSEFQETFEAVEHQVAAGGYTDIVIKSKNKEATDIVVELKSEKAPYARMIAAHAGQPCRYAEATNFARISILYCQFADDAAHKVTDTLEIRKPSNCGVSPHAVICLGTKGFLGLPSSSAVGRATTPAK
jgi:HD superfamily phosphohydrolase